MSLNQASSVNILGVLSPPYLNMVNFNCSVHFFRGPVVEVESRTMNALFLENLSFIRNVCVVNINSAVEF